MTHAERMRAILGSRVEPAWKLILISLASRMDDDASGHAGYEDVARDTGFARSTVALHIADLVKAGIVRRWQGEHLCPDHAIEWVVLREAPAKLQARGGARIRGAAQ